MIDPLTNRQLRADDIVMANMPPSLKGSSRHMAARLLDDSDIDAVHAEQHPGEDEDEDDQDEDEETS